jgi:hypothetical protein
MGEARRAHRDSMGTACGLCTSCEGRSESRYRGTIGGATPGGGGVGAFWWIAIRQPLGPRRYRFEA